MLQLSRAKGPATPKGIPTVVRRAALACHPESQRQSWIRARDKAYFQETHTSLRERGFICYAIGRRV